MNILQTPFDLLGMFDEACKTPSDINEHVHALHDLARDLGAGAHITEMGTRTGVSTIGLLTAQPKTLVCYDLTHMREVTDKLFKVRGRTDIRFIHASTLNVTIEETDMLFIDTLHTYDQLSRELSLHADKVRSILAFHDTVSFGQVGEDGKEPGLMLAIREFVDRGGWKVKFDRLNNNGLLALERC